MSTHSSDMENRGQDLPAGDFSVWLRQARSALLTEVGAEVACGDCVGCCSSSYFIHIEPDEVGAVRKIAKEVLVKAPGLPRGHQFMGYDSEGLCPMLQEGKCSIYEHRPRTCRNYDCRVFSAVGIAAGGDDKATINLRVSRWKFSYPTELDRREHTAVQSAATFIREHADCFPGGRIPTNPSQLAILAIKVYQVFLNRDEREHQVEGVSSEAGIAAAIVEACKQFDAAIGGHSRQRRPL